MPIRGVGIGGLLSINGFVTDYFFDLVTEEASMRLNRPICTAEGQQAFESLAL